MSQAVSVSVSVVIPCFRCDATIGRALTSVLNQTSQPAEIILVDDFSGDNTKAVLMEWECRHPSLIKVVCMSENRGAGSARNAGWAITTQPYVAFLDADDSWHPNKLEIQYEFMQTNPAVALCGHLCALFQDNEPEIIELNANSFHTVPKLAWLFKNAFSTPTVMLRRSLPFKFLEGRRYAEDLLLWQEIAFAEYRIVRIDASLANVHKPFFGVAGLSSHLWKMERGELGNFWRLRRRGTIGSMSFLIAFTFSLLKYCRRYWLLKLGRVPRATSQSASKGVVD
jgi:glycosyltransferase involved in cell wall biosynthesis